MGSKLSEGVGLTSDGRDELPLACCNRPYGSRKPEEQELVPTVRYQENKPRPTSGSGLKLAGDSLIFCRKANNSCLARSY
jgi:hypothetical protein